MNTYDLETRESRLTEHKCKECGKKFTHNHHRRLCKECISVLRKRTHGKNKTRLLLDLLTNNINKEGIKEKEIFNLYGIQSFTIDNKEKREEIKNTLGNLTACNLIQRIPDPKWKHDATKTKYIITPKGEQYQYKLS